MQHAPRNHALLAAEHAFELGIELIESDGGEESQTAQVYRKNWDLAPGQCAGRSQERAIAAQHDHQLRAFRHLFPGQSGVALEITRGLMVQPRFYAALLPPRHQLQQDGGRVRNAGLREYTYYLNVWHVRGTPGF